MHMLIPMNTLLSKIKIFRELLSKLLVFYLFYSISVLGTDSIIETRLVLSVQSSEHCNKANISERVLCFALIS